MQRKDGSRTPVEISLSPLTYDGEMRVTAVIRDVTERKRAETQIRDMHERFTAELTAANKELGVRNREIESANRLKTEFVASMSHELRTPLHTIIGFAELLAEEMEGPLNEKQKRFVGHIHRDSLHLLELINDILDLSRIEAGRLDLRPEVFDDGRGHRRGNGDHPSAGRGEVAASRRAFRARSHDSAPTACGSRRYSSTCSATRSSSRRKAGRIRVDGVIREQGRSRFRSPIPASEFPRSSRAPSSTSSIKWARQRAA